MNSYEEKLAARKARLEDRASSAQAESTTVYKRAKSMASVIPFGQPILGGHHSEGRDRNYRHRIHGTFGKAFALSDKAEHYKQKAASVGTGGISSDDPDAVIKLRSELAGLIESQERMKAANKAIRAHKTPEAQTAALVELKFTSEQAADLVKKDRGGRCGFPSYSLTNNNANIARVKNRIEELAKRRERAPVEEVAPGYTYREDADENRVLFLFPGKPDEATRAILKAHAFKWSPSREGQPWVRQLTNAGIYAGKQVREELKKLAAVSAE